MKRALGMFALTRAERRAIVLIVFALLLFTLARHYRDVGTIRPADHGAPPRVNATPASLPEEECGDAGE